MSETLLAEAAGLPRLAQIRSEQRKGIVHISHLGLSCQQRQSRLAQIEPIRLVLRDMALLLWNHDHGLVVTRDVLVSFAGNLRSRRKELGLSQEQLGARAGIQMADISRYESGNRDPRLSTIARLAEALEMPIGDLLTVGD